MSVPIEIINYIIDFIKTNSLGRTDYFDTKEYTEIEDQRLHKLLDICKDLLSGKLQKNNLSTSIQSSLEISKKLSDEVSQKIMEMLSSYKIPEAPEPQDNVPEIEERQPSDASKKSIFSTLIK